MSLLKRGIFYQTALVVFFHLLSFRIFAQSDPSGQRRVTDTYAITNATVFTSPGSSGRATIVIRNGLIEAVGSNLSIPIDAEEIKGDSLFVYAGFIDLAGNPGVGSPVVPENPADYDPSNPPPAIAGITPYMEVLDYYDPASDEVEQWRKAGITMVQLLPKGQGMLPGKTAVVLNGYRTSHNIVPASSNLFMKFDAVRGLYPGTKLGVMAKWRELYQNAELAMKHQAIFANNKGVVRPEKDPVLEAFFPVIERKSGMVFEVPGELDVRRAINFQKEKGFDLILIGIKEGTALIPMIKESKARVVLSLDLPDDKASKKEIKDATEEVRHNLERVKAAYRDVVQLASNFEKEEIPFAFGTREIKSDDFLKNIRLLVENGLSEDAALAALTINAAKIIGLDPIAGTIEKGKLANLVITTDSLFKKRAKVKHVFVDGYVFDYESNEKKKGDGTGDQDITGTWNYEAETPEGSSSGTMNITKESEVYKGTITYDDPGGAGKGSTEMLDINYSESMMEFQYSVDVQGMAISVSVSGEFEGDEYKGKLSITDFGNFPFNATKVPDSKKQ